MSNHKITRRSFLKSFTKTAAGIITSPYIITTTMLGKDTTLPPSERIALGHIGVGQRGANALLKSFLDLEDAQCAAVCDPFRSKRERWAKYVDSTYAVKKEMGSYKGCMAYNDFRDLLARDDIDAVVVATPDHWHVPIALAAARAGKDMYVEKPLGLSIEQNRTLRTGIKSYGRVFQYGTQQRSGRNFRFACELVQNGRVGELKTIQAWCPGKYGKHESSTKPIPVPAGFDYDLWLGPAPWSPYTNDRCTYRGSWYVSDNSLGFIAGWGAHALDIAQWGNNTEYTCPIKYEGIGIFPTDGLFDTPISWDVKCHYANGVELHFMSHDVARPIIKRYRKDNDHGTTFIGADGWVSVDRDDIYAEPSSLLKSIIGPSEIHLYESKSHSQNFLDCIRTRAETVSPIAPAVQSDMISHLSDITIRTGRQIMWDPEKEVIIDDEEASRLLSRPMRSPWHL